MQSKATTVSAYLASLPADRRAALEAVRKVILKNLDRDYSECMQYGMIGYAVPHSVYPAGYHCDPRQPLPYAGLASQKNYMSLYLMGVYMNPEQEEWFHAAWAKSGKRLDMGKSCVRFKSLDDLPLDVIGETIRRVPAKKLIAFYEAALASRGQRPAQSSAKAKGAPAAKPKLKAQSKAKAKAKAPARR